MALEPCTRHHPLESYADFLSKLVALVGRRVSVGISGIGDEPPPLSYEGTLEPALEAGKTVGSFMSSDSDFERHLLHLSVGDLELVLHPEHFREGTWSEELGHLSWTMGRTSLWISTAPTAELAEHRRTSG
jgi:hypothetical protein